MICFGELLGCSMPAQHLNMTNLNLDFIKHFFKEYKPVHLNIWHTFTDTILSELLKMKEL